MAQVITAETITEFRAWVRAGVAPLGVAASSWQLAFGGADGSNWSVPIRGDLATAAWATVANSGFTGWCVELPPFQHNAWLRSAAVAVSVAFPGVEHWARADSRKAPSRDWGAAREAVELARLMRELTALPNEVKKAVIVATDQQLLWRPRMGAGIALNQLGLVAKREELSTVRAHSKSLFGVDLFDQQTAKEWAPAHGITIKDKNGEPSISKDDFDRAVVSPGSEEHWKRFKEVRRFAAHAGKVVELTRANRNGRVYPHISPYSARTGRMSVSKPALQNITASSRGLLAADPGYALVSLDYSKMEPTVAAGLSGDLGLAADLAAGDVYVGLAVRAGGTAADREDFKTAWIAVAYGLGEAALALKLGISASAAKDLRAGIWRAYPTLAAYVASEQEDLRSGNRIPLASGRPFGVEPGGHTVLNSRVQGHAADTMYAATTRVAAVLGPEALWLAIHDELVLQVPLDEAENARQVLEREMPTDINGVPLGGTATILGPVWGKG